MVINSNEKLLLGKVGIDCTSIFPYREADFLVDKLNSPFINASMVK